jgi:phosphoglycerate kinase
MKTLESLSWQGQRALVRVDLNVPLNNMLEVTDNNRIKAIVPTIRYLMDHGAAVILMSHLGRPKGGPDPAFSLAPVVQPLAELLGAPVQLAHDCIGPDAEAKVNALQPGQVLLLENVRFHPEEEAGDPAFAAALARWGTAYVNDAFGTAHRAHASTAIIAQYFPGKSAFGRVMAAEIDSVTRVMQQGEHPVLAIIGGAKVSSKITILNNLLPAVDHLIIGGGMAFTFLRAQGGHTGNSLVEEDYIETARQVLATAAQAGKTIYLPVDSLNADAFSADANTQVSSASAIPAGWMGLDIGPETERLFSDVVLKSRTILWNGPVGVFELEPFSRGTKALGQAIADATANGAFSLVGGGDSVAAVKQFGLEESVSYVSTGGGAMLEFLEGRTLPGIKAVLEA